MTMKIQLPITSANMDISTFKSQKNLVISE